MRAKRTQERHPIPGGHAAFPKCALRGYVSTFLFCFVFLFFPLFSSFFSAMQKEIRLVLLGKLKQAILGKGGEGACESYGSCFIHARSCLSFKPFFFFFSLSPFSARTLAFPFPFPFCVNEENMVMFIFVYT